MGYGYGERGFREATGEFLLGTVESTLIAAIPAVVSKSLSTTNAASLSNLVSAVLIISSVIGFMEWMDAIDYWSLTYLIGWFIALVLVGRFLMADWEFELYFLVSIAVIFIKIARKTLGD